MDLKTFDTVGKTFPYLVDKSKATGGGFVGSLRFVVFDNNTTFSVGDLEIKSFSVEHGISSDGLPFMCNSFKMENIVYMSDVNFVPKDVIPDLLDLDLLLLDCLREGPPYLSHFILSDVYKLLSIIKPKKTLLVGMSHSLEHYHFKQLLSSHSLSIEPSRDGQRIQFNSHHR